MTYPNPMDALYGKIANSEVSSGGTYLVPGVYSTRVESVFFKTSRKNKMLFIVELTLLETSTPVRPQGSSASWTCNLTDHDSAAGNVKAFIGACLGIPANDLGRLNTEITPAVISGVSGPNNPLGGLVLHCEVSEQDTKAGGKFNRHSWGPVSGRDATWTAKAATPAPAPSVPSIPGVPAIPGVPRLPPPPPAPFPPVGWQVHPSAPGWYWNPSTNEVKAEADLRS